MLLSKPIIIVIIIITIIIKKKNVGAILTGTILQWGNLTRYLKMYLV